jgi:hypothetical protein
MNQRILVLFSLLFFQSSLQSQPLTSNLVFEQGQEFEITMQTKTTIAQQAMGQSIDFTINATGIHTYKVTNSTEDNTTLHHEVKKVLFAFDGMGQKRNFDSDDEKDMKGPFGKPIQEMKDKYYDMIIDTTGNVLMAFPEKIAITGSDNRIAMITNMMDEVLDIVQPPKKGTKSIFKVLPEKPINNGDSWTDTFQDENGQFNTTYTLTGITDSTILIDFTGTTVTIKRAEMMGNETITTMNSKLKGKIILDKSTRILREKMIDVEGTGNTETSFGTLPVTTKSTIHIMVKSKE